MLTLVEVCGYSWTVWEQAERTTSWQTDNSRSRFSWYLIVCYCYKIIQFINSSNINEICAQLWRGHGHKIKTTDKKNCYCFSIRQDLIAFTIWLCSHASILFILCKRHCKHCFSFSDISVSIERKKKKSTLVPFKSWIIKLTDWLMWSQASRWKENHGL